MDSILPSDSLQVNMHRALEGAVRLSAGRSRRELKNAIVEMLAEAFGAERVRLYRLFFPANLPHYSVSAQYCSGKLESESDEVTWPDALYSLDSKPDLSAATEAQGAYAHAHGVLTPVRVSIDKPVYGLIEVEKPGGLHPAQINVLQKLTEVYSNMLALLDYSEADSLTGLLNRKTFDQSFLEILATLQQSEETVPNVLPHRRIAHQAAEDHWLAVIDIDFFKRINDDFGHLIGDEVLLLVANLMRESFRNEDHLFRFGGEEFVVVLKPTPLEKARVVFERFREKVSEHPFPQVGKITVSIGYSRIGRNALPAAVIERADKALYWVKDNGRNQVCMYEDLESLNMLDSSGVRDAGDVELF